jgi:diketogulonate reductase-like aldo/keto reductase
MEECYKLGLAKSIGICNYGTKKLTKLLETATITPAVNQVCMKHAFLYIVKTQPKIELNLKTKL